MATRSVLMASIDSSTLDNESQLEQSAFSASMVIEDMRKQLVIPSSFRLRLRLPLCPDLLFCLISSKFVQRGIVARSTLARSVTALARSAATLRRRRQMVGRSGVVDERKRGVNKPPALGQHGRGRSRVML